MTAHGGDLTQILGWEREVQGTMLHVKGLLKGGDV